MTADLEVHAALQEGADLPALLRAEQEHNLLLQEAIAELESEDLGWSRLDGGKPGDFSRNALTAIAATSRLNYLANPLIRRAVNVRTYYTWGQGVELSVRDDDVNTVVQDFLDDPMNQQVLFSQDARCEKDRDLQLDGNLFLALFTSPLTGRVQVRSLPFAEIADVLTHPEDREQRQFYRRKWTATDPDSGTPREFEALYPDIGYRPLRRPRTIGTTPVSWDSPVVHVRVGGVGGMKFGVPEVYAALFWARAYRGFLEDWAGLAKALSRFAWKGKTRPGRVSEMRRNLEAAPVPHRGGQAPAGQGFVADPDTDLTPISKTGATLDATSGRPLAMMVSAAMDVPYTILMGDADIGNRATARTLDRPTELAMQGRREVWAGVTRTLLNYVIDQAVKAPSGPLSGTVRRPADQPNREVIALAGDADRGIDVSWPSILQHEQRDVVEAIVAADGTRRLPPEVVCRLLLLALDVEDVDELMDELTDDDGKFLDPQLAATVASVVPQPEPPAPAPVEALREAARPVPPQEQYTDFDAVQSDWQVAVDAAVAAYLAEREEQSAELARQVADGVTAPAELTLAGGAFAGVLLAALQQLHARAGSRAALEVLAQGQSVTPPDPDLAFLTAHADVVADLLARSLTSSAAREALRLTGLDDADVAAAVRLHLAALTDAQPRELIGGALTAAQNAAREAVFGQVVGGAFYAAERLDRNTCSPCQRIDGVRFDTVLAAAQAYPTGGYVDCAGRERCRGLLVWWAGAADIPT